MVWELEAAAWAHTGRGCPSSCGHMGAQNSEGGQAAGQAQNFQVVELVS